MRPIRAAAVLTGGFVAANPVRVRDHAYLDLLVDVQAQGSVTEIEIDFQTSIESDEEPSSSQWAQVQAEEVSSGVATLSDYVVKKTISGAIKIPIQIPAVGVWIRPRVRASAGTVTGSSVAITALPRLAGV